MAAGRKTGGRDFQPGHPKFAGAGRVKGTLNRDTREAVQIMVEAGYNPIAAMVKLATTEDTPVEMKVKLAAELARYAYHPRKAMDLWHFDHNFRNPKSGVAPRRLRGSSSARRYMSRSR